MNVMTIVDNDSINPTYWQQGGYETDPVTSDDDVLIYTDDISNRREKSFPSNDFSRVRLATQSNNDNCTLRTSSGIDGQNRLPFNTTYRRVSFSFVTLREYPYEIGDNPASPSGPALSIRWNYSNEQTIPFDEYENMRPQCDRRTGDKLKVPPEVRYEILRSAGYSQLQIQKETRLVNVARRQRLRTIESHKMFFMEEISEKLTKKTMNILSFGTMKRKEKKYIQDAILFHQSR